MKAHTHSSWRQCCTATHWIWGHMATNDTASPALTPMSWAAAAFPAESVIACAVRHTCITPQVKIVSLVGLVSFKHHVGIYVLASLNVLSRRSSPGKLLTQPRGSQSSLPRKKICSRFRFVPAEEERKLWLSSFAWASIISSHSLQTDHLSTQKLQIEWTQAFPCGNFLLTEVFFVINPVLSNILSSSIYTTCCLMYPMVNFFKSSP